MAALKPAGRHTENGKIHTGETDEKQNDEVARFLKRHNRVNFRFVASICLLLVVRKDGFKSKWHVLVHDESHEKLHTFLRESLSSLVFVT